ncbi:hypothetical protein [Sulfurimonas sp. HSL3-2]|uniref:hypothetical protein n=1 Tax=Hydrocurvibacter mobilis TaxID=3131936 RepID=UPI0031FA159B
MKKLLLSILFFGVLFAQEASYTIIGEKDPRLDARYMMTYVSQNLESDACSHYVRLTGFRRPKIAGKNISVPDGNYTIKIPIIMKNDKNECNYRFAGLLLIMKRKHDKELSSIHYILSDKQKVSPIYYKTKGGAMSLKEPDAPSALSTDKKYFRIAPKSTFLCKTFWYEYRKGSSFHCTMQIDDDVNRTRYIDKEHSDGHPEFGVDEIKDTMMKIDILVDEKNCRANLGRDNINAQDHFREVKQSIWQKLF